MAKVRAFQNPYLERHIPHWAKEWGKDAQRLKNTIEADIVEITEEVDRTLNPANGRARYTNGGDHSCAVFNCIQMVDMLPWWRKLLVPFFGKYCSIGGVKYLKVGQTNILYRAQEWIAGRAAKSILRIV